MLAVWTFIAEAEGAKSGPPGGFDFLPLVLIGLSFLIFIIMPMRRDRRQRMEMLSLIEKGDRVVVNGAIVGTVMQIDKGDEKDPEDKLQVRIDENANVKMRVLRSSVTRVVKKESAKEGA